jgi:adenylate kinase
MRVVVTGQVGLDKGALLQRVADLAGEEGIELTLCNVGDMMYAEAPDVAPGRILDLPLSRLHSLRRSVFKDILAAARRRRHVVVNTHATFRWRHGLFCAFDHDQMLELSADLYVVVLDNVDRVHYRLARDGHADHTLKDLMVWREEEILATELLSKVVGRHGSFYLAARGGEAGASGAAETLLHLLCHPQRRKAYLSFPMSHVADAPDVLVAIAAFRREMKRLFTCFDPADMEEKYLAELAEAAVRQGRRWVKVGPPGARTVVDANEVLSILPDIDGQIYARDFKLIDQSDMIVSLVPVLAGGQPGLSSGVERELQHAHEATREVFVIWRPDQPPSPFVTETATRVFRRVDQAVRYFLDAGYVAGHPVGRLFE